MFKFGSVENEIMESMEKQLVENQVENDHGFNKLVQATDFLNHACMILEQAGMTKEAEDIITILNTLVK